MSKFLRLTALAATVAVAFGATGAVAATSATADATAKARVLKPLQLTSKQNLDLGTIVLSGAAPFTATVGIDRNGTFTCGTKVTCSSTHQVAVYNVAGTKSQPVTIAAGNVTMSDGAGHSLTLTPDFNTTVNLTNSGAPGTDFNVGGSITVADTTADGVYTGTFAVTADYQ
jgi:Mat/Ecp fimbriae major subunit